MQNIPFSVPPWRQALLKESSKNQKVLAVKGLEELLHPPVSQFQVSVFMGTFCTWPCRILATGLGLHYRKNPHTVDRKQLNNTTLAAKKKMNWQFLASVHKTRMAFVSGMQKTPRETRTSL